MGITILITTLLAAVNGTTLAHAPGANRSEWSKTLPILIAKGVNVVAVELRLTSLADGVETTNRDVALETNSILLAGHSDGGFAIAEAAREPKTVARFSQTLPHAMPESELFRWRRPDSGG